MGLKIGASSAKPELDVALQAARRFTNRIATSITREMVNTVGVVIFEYKEPYQITIRLNEDAAADKDIIR